MALAEPKERIEVKISVLAKPQSPLIKKAISVARIHMYIANSLQMK